VIVSNTIRSKVLIVTLCLIVAAFAGGFTYAMFTDKAVFNGALISVGSADLKLYSDLSKSANDPGNLVDSLPSPQLLEVTPSFTQDYLVKIYNNSSKPFVLTSNANYTTAEDPDDLRRYINVEIINWNDNNTNGTLEGDELGDSLGKQNIIDWKSNGFSLNDIESKTSRSLILRFTAEDIPDTKMGKTGLFSFDFSSYGQ